MTQTLVYDATAVGESPGEFVVFDMNGTAKEGNVAQEFGQATIVIGDSGDVFNVPHGMCRFIADHDYECDCERGYLQDGSEPRCVPIISHRLKMP
jgi:hypothetical protein